MKSSSCEGGQVPDAPHLLRTQTVFPTADDRLGIAGIVPCCGDPGIGYTRMRVFGPEFDKSTLTVFGVGETMLSGADQLVQNAYTLTAARDHVQSLRML